MRLLLFSVVVLLLSVSYGRINVTLTESESILASSTYTASQSDSTTVSGSDGRFSETITQSLSESPSTTDTITESDGRVTDSLTLTESSSGSATFSLMETPSDTTTFSPTTTLEVTLTTSLSASGGTATLSPSRDGAGGTFTMSASSSFTPTVSLSASFTSELTMSESATKTHSMTETFILSDTPSATLSMTETDSLSVVVTPTGASGSFSATVASTVTIQESETSTLSGTFSMSMSESSSLSPTVTITDSMSISDSKSVTVSASETHTPSLAVSESGSETVSASVNESSSIMPSVTLSMSPSTSLIETLSASTTLSSSESVTMQTNTVGESMSTTFSLGESASQSITLSASITGSLSSTETLSHSLAVTKTVSIGTPSQTLLATETVSVSSTASLTLSMEPTSTHLLTASGSMTVSTTIGTFSMTSTVKSSDTVSNTESFSVPDTDTLSVPESASLSTSATTSVSTSPSLSSSNSASTSLVVSGTSSVSITDSLSVSDSVVTGSLSMPGTDTSSTSNSASVGPSVTTELTPSVYTQSLSATESLSQSESFSWSLEQSLTLSESISVSLSSSSSASVSASIDVSPSSTVIPSSSSSGSMSGSLMLTESAPISATVTGSESSSATATLSVSDSATSTISASPTVTDTFTMPESGSVTTSGSLTITSEETLSSPGSTTVSGGSESATESHANTLSLSESDSITQTLSESSSWATLSASASVVPSSTMSAHTESWTSSFAESNTASLPPSSTIHRDSRSATTTVTSSLGDSYTMRLSVSEGTETFTSSLSPTETATTTISTSLAPSQSATYGTETGTQSNPTNQITLSSSLQSSVSVSSTTSPTITFSGSQNTLSLGVTVSESMNPTVSVGLTVSSSEASASETITVSESPSDEPSGSSSLTETQMVSESAATFTISTSLETMSGSETVGASSTYMVTPSTTLNPTVSSSTSSTVSGSLSDVTKSESLKQTVSMYTFSRSETTTISASISASHDSASQSFSKVVTQTDASESISTTGSESFTDETTMSTSDSSSRSASLETSQTIAASTTESKSDGSVSRSDSGTFAVSDSFSTSATTSISLLSATLSDTALETLSQLSDTFSLTLTPSDMSPTSTETARESKTTTTTGSVSETLTLSMESASFTSTHAQSPSTTFSASMSFTGSASLQDSSTESLDDSRTTSSSLSGATDSAMITISSSQETDSASSSPSPTATVIESVSKTLSASTSESGNTPSLLISGSSTFSVSESFTGSETQPTTRTASFDDSISMSMSETLSGTDTLAVSGSATITVSESTSTTSTMTLSASTSESASSSASQSASFSETVVLTPTADSSTVTASDTTSFSLDVSESAGSLTATGSLSELASDTLSESPSHSIELTPSRSFSHTKTFSRSQNTHSDDISGSTSESVTRSFVETVSASDGTETISVPSVSDSASLIDSASATTTETATTSASMSTTHSGGSETISSSDEATMSTSIPQTLSTTHSLDVTVSKSVDESVTRTLSLSESTTVALTESQAESTTRTVSDETATLATTPSLTIQEMSYTSARVVKPSGNVRVGQPVVVQLLNSPPYAVGDKMYMVPYVSHNPTDCSTRATERHAVLLAWMSGGHRLYNWTGTSLSAGQFSLCFWHPASNSWSTPPLPSPIVFESRIVSNTLSPTSVRASGAATEFSIEVDGATEGDRLLLVPMRSYYADAYNQEEKCRPSGRYIVVQSSRSVSGSTFRASAMLPRAEHYVVCYLGYPHRDYHFAHRFVTVYSQVTSTTLSTSPFGEGKTQYLANQWVVAIVSGYAMSTIDKFKIVQGASCASPTMSSTPTSIELLTPHGHELTSLSIRFSAHAPVEAMSVCYRGNFTSYPEALFTVSFTEISAASVTPTNVTSVSGSFMEFQFTGKLLSELYDTAWLCLHPSSACAGCSNGTVPLSAVGSKATPNSWWGVAPQVNSTTIGYICYASNVSSGVSPVGFVDVVPRINAVEPAPMKTSVATVVTVHGHGLSLDDTTINRNSVRLIEPNGTCSRNSVTSIPTAHATFIINTTDNSVIVTPHMVTGLIVCVVQELRGTAVASSPLYVESAPPTAFTPTVFDADVTTLVTFSPGGGEFYNFAASNDTVVPCAGSALDFVIIEVVSSSALRMRFLSAPLSDAPLCFAAAANPSDLQQIGRTSLTVRPVVNGLSVQDTQHYDVATKLHVVPVDQNVTISIDGVGIIQDDFVGLCDQHPNGSYSFAQLGAFEKSGKASNGMLRNSYRVSSPRTAIFWPCAAVAMNKSNILVLLGDVRIAFATQLESAVQLPNSPHRHRSLGEIATNDEYVDVTTPLNADSSPSISNVGLIPYKLDCQSSVQNLIKFISNPKTTSADSSQGSFDRVSTWNYEGATMYRGNFSICYTSGVAPMVWFRYDPPTPFVITGSVNAAQAYSTVEEGGKLFAGCPSQIVQVNGYSIVSSDDLLYMAPSSEGCAQTTDRANFGTPRAFTNGDNGYTNITFNVQLTTPGNVDFCAQPKHVASPLRIGFATVMAPAHVSGKTIVLKCSDTSSGSKLYKFYVLAKGSTTPMPFGESTTSSKVLPTSPDFEGEVIVEEYSVDLNAGGATTLLRTVKGTTNATARSATQQEAIAYCTNFPQALTTTGTSAKAQSEALSEGMVNLLNYKEYNCGQLIKQNLVPSTSDSTAIVGQIQSIMRNDPELIGDKELALDTLGHVVTNTYTTATVTEPAIESLLSATDLSVVKSIGTPAQQKTYAVAQVGMIDQFVGYLEEEQTGSQAVASKVLERLNDVGDMMCEHQSADVQTVSHSSINFTVALLGTSNTINSGPDVAINPTASGTTTGKNCVVLFNTAKNILPQRAIPSTATTRRQLTKVGDIVPLPEFNLPVVGMFVPKLSKMSVSLKHYASRVDKLTSFRFHPDDTARPFLGGAWFEESYAYNYEQFPGKLTVNVTDLESTGNFILVANRAEVIPIDPDAIRKEASLDQWITYSSYVIGGILAFQIFGSVCGVCYDMQIRKQLREEETAYRADRNGSDFERMKYDPEVTIPDATVQQLHRWMMLATYLPLARHFQSAKRPAALPLGFVGTAAKINAISCHLLVQAVICQMVLNAAEVELIPFLGHDIVGTTIVAVLMAQPFSALSRAALLSNGRDSVGVVSGILMTIAVIAAFFIHSAMAAAITSGVGGSIVFALAFAALRKTWRIFHYSQVNVAMRAAGGLLFIAIEAGAIVLLLVHPYATDRVFLARDDPYMPHFNAYLAWLCFVVSVLADALVVEPAKVFVLARLAAHGMELTAEHHIKRIYKRRRQELPPTETDNSGTDADLPVRVVPPTAGNGMYTGNTLPTTPAPSALRKKSPKALPPDDFTSQSELEEYDGIDDDDEFEELSFYDDSDEIDIVSTHSSMFSDLPPAFGTGPDGGDHQSGLVEELGDSLASSPVGSNAPRSPSRHSSAHRQGSMSQHPSPTRHASPSLANPLGEQGLWIEDPHDGTPASRRYNGPGQFSLHTRNGAHPSPLRSRYANSTEPPLRSRYADSTEGFN